MMKQEEQSKQRSFFEVLFLEVAVNMFCFWKGLVNDM